MCHLGDLGYPVPDPASGLAIFLSDRDNTTPLRPDGSREVSCFHVSYANAAREAWHFWKYGRLLSKGFPPLPLP